MHFITSAVIVCTIVLLVCPWASAHRLIPNDGSHVSAETALTIETPAVSQVVYHEATSDAPRLWIAFHGQEGQQQYLQLGVPVLDRLADFRPALVVIGPGLPQIELPFPIPEELGGLLLRGEEGDARFFNEHFTGTQSWILLEKTVPLAQTGDYYLVAFDPENRPGKYWVALGRKEVFTLQDFLTYPETVRVVRAFHEVDRERLPLLPKTLIAVATAVRFVLRCFGL